MKGYFANQKQRFGIRKLTIGVLSCFLGMVIAHSDLAVVQAESSQSIAEVKENEVVPEEVVIENPEVVVGAKAEETEEKVEIETTDREIQPEVETDKLNTDLPAPLEASTTNPSTENIRDITRLDIVRRDPNREQTDFSSWNGETQTLGVQIEIGGVSTIIQDAYVTVTVPSKNIDIRNTRLSALNNSQTVSVSGIRLPDGTYAREFKVQFGTLTPGTKIELPLLVKTQTYLSQASEVPLAVAFFGIDPVSQTSIEIVNKKLTLVANHKELSPLTIRLGKNTLGHHNNEIDKPYIGNWDLRTNTVATVSIREYNYSVLNNSYHNVGVPKDEDYQIRIKAPDNVTIKSRLIAHVDGNHYYMTYRSGVRESFTAEYVGTEKVTAPWTIELDVVDKASKKVISKELGTSVTHSNYWRDYIPIPNNGIAHADIKTMIYSDENGKPARNASEQFSSSINRNRLRRARVITSMQVESTVANDGTYAPIKLEKLRLSVPLHADPLNVLSSLEISEIIIPKDIERREIIDPITHTTTVLHNKNLREGELFYERLDGTLVSLGRLNDLVTNEGYRDLFRLKKKIEIPKDSKAIVINWDDDSYYSSKMVAPLISAEVRGVYNISADDSLIFGKNDQNTIHSFEEGTQFKSVGNFLSYNQRYSGVAVEGDRKTIEKDSGQIWFYVPQKASVPTQPQPPRQPQQPTTQGYELRLYRNKGKQDSFISDETTVYVSITRSSEDMLQTVKDARIGVLLPTGLVLSQIKRAHGGDLAATEIEKIQYNYKDTGMDLYIIKRSGTNEKDPLQFSSLKDKYIGFDMVLRPTTALVPIGHNGDKVITNGIYAFVIPTLVEGRESLKIKYVPIGTSDDIYDLNNDGNTTTDTVIKGARLSYNFIPPKAIFIYNQNSDNNKINYTFDTNRIKAGQVNPFKTIIVNNSEVAYTDITVITTIPKKGDKTVDGLGNRGTQFDTTLVGAVTPPDGWQVLYTFVPHADGMNVAELTGWVSESQITDWTKVTALKYVSNPDVILERGRSIEFLFELQTPTTVKPGQGIVSTSAIAVNGSTRFLEGYRSTSTIEKDNMYITGTIWHDANKSNEVDKGESFSSQKTVQLFYEDGVTPVLDIFGNPVTSITNAIGKYRITPPYGDTNYRIKVISEIEWPFRYVTGVTALSDILSITRTTPTSIANFPLTIAGTVKKLIVSNIGQILQENIHKDEIGSNYTVIPEENITDENGYVWTYSHLHSESDSLEGTVMWREKLIIMIYTPKLGGAVITKYVDAQGNALSPEVVIHPVNTPVGTAYTATANPELTVSGLVYVLQTTPANESGRVAEVETVVTYVYVPKIGADVTVKHITDTGVVLIPEMLVQDDAQVGTTYTTAPEAKITDSQGRVWQYSKLASGSATATGTVGTTVQHVVYEYIAQPGGAVIAKYVDTQGNALSPEVVIHPVNTQVGTAYTAIANPELTVSGLVYTLQTIPANESGKVAETETIVMYTYVLKPVPLPSDVVEPQQTDPQQQEPQQEVPQQEETIQEVPQQEGPQREESQQTGQSTSNAIRITSNLEGNILPRTGSESALWLNLGGIVTLLTATLLRKKTKEEE